MGLQLSGLFSLKVPEWVRRIKVETVRAAFSLPIPEESETLLIDDFQFTNEIGSPPPEKATWIGMGPKIKVSFPDIDITGLTMLGQHGIQTGGLSFLIKGRVSGKELPGPG
jgi:hypothetical protein